MKISTFNIQNDFKDYNKEKSIEIIKYLKNNKIDILGMQEVFSKCDNDICELINNKYFIEGKYRFKFKRLLNRINEKNPIISKYKIISHNTYHLPHFPSFTKRVLTHIVISYNNKEISIYNTHLEVDRDNVKIKQLDKIEQIIKEDNRPIILMGDFNLKNNNDIFNSFISDLEKLNIKRISLNEKTFKESSYSREIDHIFISNNFKLISKEVIKDLDISDHYPVIVDIELKY